jgi:thiamine-phosphate pyrophosphorylase
MSVSPELLALQRLAQRLAARAPVRNRPGLPPLLILTDPLRTADPVGLAERLPSGAGLVYRPFGASDAAVTARVLARVARRRSLVLLIGADAELAKACGAAGVHLPERLAFTAPRLRARWPEAILTAAAHGAHALHRAEAAGVDAALLSAVFPSRSPSAGAPLGPVRTTALARGVGLPVLALGGVSARTALRLAGTGVWGIAAVGAALPPRG